MLSAIEPGTCCAHLIVGHEAAARLHGEGRRRGQISRPVPHTGNGGCSTEACCTRAATRAAPGQSPRPQALPGGVAIRVRGLTAAQAHLVGVGEAHVDGGGPQSDFLEILSLPLLQRRCGLRHRHHALNVPLSLPWGESGSTASPISKGRHHPIRRWELGDGAPPRSWLCLRRTLDSKARAP